MEDIPIKLIKEAVGHKVFVEDFNKNTFVGKLSEAEDNMNVVLEKVKMTTKQGWFKIFYTVYFR